MIYNSLMRDEAIGNIDFETDSVYVLLLSSGYTPDKNHDKRSDLTNEIVADGYTEGGQAAEVTVTEDGDNNRVEISLGGAVWNPATITARYAVYYKRRGGSSADDELIYCNEFPSDVSSTSGSFTVQASTIRKQN